MKLNLSYFYAHAELSVPSDISHRHFRARIGEDWIKLPRIHSIDELRAKLVALMPNAVYMSVSTWLNPELLGSKHENKAGYPMLANCLLSSDFLADFDEESTPEDASKAVIYSVNAGFNEFAFTDTSRGAHLWIKDFYKLRCTKKIASPKDRISYVTAQRKKLADELVKAGVVFDYKISADPYRVARLWGSLHDDGKTICKTYSTFTPFLESYTLRRLHALREGMFRPPLANKGFSGADPMTQKCSKETEPDLEVRGYTSNLAGVKLTLHPHIYK